MAAYEDDGYSVKVPPPEATEAQIEALLRLMAADGQNVRPRASIPAVGGLLALFVWLAVVALALAFAWPVGLSAHAVWWLFSAGWGVIG